MEKKIKLAQVLKSKIGNERISDLAKSAGISKSIMHDWLNGKAPSAKNLIAVSKLASKYGLTLEEILFGEPEVKNIAAVQFDDDGRSYSVIVKRLK